VRKDREEVREETHPGHVALVDHLKNFVLF
jgi:hypothetical protein